MATSGRGATRPDSGKAPPGHRAGGVSPRRARRDHVTPENVDSPGSGRDNSERQQREARILDAAATLLVRWGFRKTTIDDVAREAGVGKGTIYLHWRDKNELFRAAIWRAYELLSEDILQRIKSDPEGGLPHRLWTHGMIATLDNPLMAAIMRDQSDIFQGLMGGLDQMSRMKLSGNAEEYVTKLQRAGLVRSDLEPSHITYVMTALKVGIINAPDILGRERAPSLEQLTDTVSDLMRRWLEPEKLPSESEEGKQLLESLLEGVQEVGESSLAKGEQK
ncbi:MAG TPA: helix-turn-helix domain-containing protein [Ktedonobacterales bacterium]